MYVTYIYIYIYAYYILYFLKTKKILFIKISLIKVQDFYTHKKTSIIFLQSMLWQQKHYIHKSDEQFNRVHEKIQCVFYESIFLLLFGVIPQLNPRCNMQCTSVTRRRRRSQQLAAARDSSWQMASLRYTARVSSPAFAYRNP